MKKTRFSLTIAIPAYNEETTIQEVVKDALKILQQLTADYEILLVDDGSTDKTAKIVDQLAQNNKHIRVVHHKKNKGFTGAIKSCYTNARKELVFLAPADGQVGFSDLPAFVKKIEQGYDVAVGYRIKNPMPFYRKLNSWLFHCYCRYLLKLPFRELSTAILWKKIVLDSVTIESAERSAMIEPEILYKAKQKGFTFGEVPFVFLPRRGGKPKGANPKMIVRTCIEMFTFWVHVACFPRLKKSITKLQKLPKLQLIMLLIAGFLVMMPTLMLQFWNDDFSLLYNMGVLHQPHAYPYHTIVPFYTPLYLLFGLQPFGYFAFGLFCFLVSITVFYLFCQTIFKNSSFLPFLATLVYATSPIGIDSNLRSITYAFNYIAIILQLLLLILLMRYFVTKQRTFFFFTLVLFYISLEIIPFRAFLFLPILFLFDLFMQQKSKFSLKPFLMRQILLTIPLIAYYILRAPSLQVAGSAYQSAVIIDKVGKISFPNVLFDNLQAVLNTLFGGILLLIPNVAGSLAESRYELIGVAVAFVTGIFVWKIQLGKINLLPIIIFSLLWIFVNATSYYVLTIAGVAETNARHMIFSSPAYALVIASFFYLVYKKLPHQRKLSILLFISIVMANSIATVLYFQRFHANRTIYAKQFFEKVYAIFPTLPKGALVFIQAPVEPVSHYRVANILTVGYYPSDATFGVLYNKKIEDIHLFDTMTDLTMYLEKHPTDITQVYGLSYTEKDANVVLQNITEETRTNVKKSAKQPAQNIEE